MKPKPDLMRITNRTPAKSIPHIRRYNAFQKFLAKVYDPANYEPYEGPPLRVGSLVLFDYGNTHTPCIGQVRELNTAANGTVVIPHVGVWLLMNCATGEPMNGWTPVIICSRLKAIKDLPETYAKAIAPSDADFEEQAALQFSPEIVAKDRAAAAGSRLESLVNG